MGSAQMRGDLWGARGRGWVVLLFRRHWRSPTARSMQKNFHRRSNLDRLAPSDQLTIWEL